MPHMDHTMNIPAHVQTSQPRPVSATVVVQMSDGTTSTIEFPAGASPLGVELALNKGEPSGLRPQWHERFESLFGSAEDVRLTLTRTKSLDDDPETPLFTLSMPVAP